ncbi:UxaA family hydrolase [Metallosphaera tengchongensis]|uniref:UxaA family hydrolase n=1 Tax=Metallosphaera tengchongensis TaxID=1532350 RepID=A0A6N0NTU8_9CREN|nr:UxaA family hydrolase [Metallosphaera tengchongensis]QKR00196.1 UxaA family hydrolase [Metallosphaera tengchongensis]
MARGLIHSDQDNVCVATTDIKKGEEVLCAYLEGNSHLIVKSVDDIPLGHKIAVKDVRQGEKVIKYGRPIGVATQSISKGQHVHVHNLKSMRWGK